MPADCTGTAVPVTEVETAPAAGWPAAIAPAASNAIPKPRLAAFPRTTNQELARAIALARAARDERFTVSIKGRALRRAYYDRRDSEELKAERLKAKEAVPHPDALTVPRLDDGGPYLVAVEQKFSDGTSTVYRVPASDCDSGLKRLRYASEISTYYKDDPAGLERAMRAWAKWQRAQSDAEEAVVDLPALQEAYRANIPAEQASHAKWDAALVAIRAIRPRSIDDALVKAKAVAALGDGRISSDGALTMGEHARCARADELPDLILETLWADLLALAEERTPKAGECSGRELAQRYLAWLDVERLNLAHELGLYHQAEAGRPAAIQIPMDRFVDGDRDRKDPVSSRARTVLRAAEISLESDWEPPCSADQGGA